jgi:enoyl-CoA hydratase/carnithine racemase
VVGPCRRSRLVDRDVSPASDNWRAAQPRDPERPSGPRQPAQVRHGENSTDGIEVVDNLVRLSRLPAATISMIRGRARGAGSEFVLATDIRFASEKAILGQFEVGVGAVPGGGPMARLGRLVGRGRALEVLLGGEDITADLAAAYGYVNRVIPDAEIEDATDAFARRIAAFDRVAVAGIKQLVDVATLPDNNEFAEGLSRYFATAGRPENRPLVQQLLARGLQQPDRIETDLGTVIGTLRQNPEPAERTE